MSLLDIRSCRYVWGLCNPEGTDEQFHVWATEQERKHAVAMWNWFDSLTPEQQDKATLYAQTGVISMPPRPK